MKLIMGFGNRLVASCDVLHCDKRRFTVRRNFPYRPDDVNPTGIGEGFVFRHRVLVLEYCSHRLELGVQKLSQRSYRHTALIGAVPTSALCRHNRQA